MGQLVRCTKPNLFEKSKNSFDVNCGPLSDITNSRIPFLENTDLQLLTIAMGCPVTLRVVVVLEDIFFPSHIHCSFLLFL